MTLIALHRMGANVARLRRYADRFKDPAGEGERPYGAGGAPFTRETWREGLGRFANFPRYVAYFEERAKGSSVEAVLKETLPVLADGSAGAAYHPLIRLGYAIDTKSEPEILYALAYWAATHLPAPAFDPKAKPAEPDDILARIVEATPDLRIEPKGNIVTRMTRVYAFPAFTGVLAPVRFPKGRPLERISELLLEQFSGTQHFTLLHAFTSCQALRLVLPFAGDPAPVVNAYWHSACAAYLTVSRGGFPIGKDVLPASKEEGWPAIHAQCAADRMAGGSEEHIVKLTYSAWCEDREYGRGGYLAVASREIARPSPFG